MDESAQKVAPCPKCASEQPAKNDFCSNCGAQLRVGVGTPKETKSPKWPLIIGLACGVLVGIYNYQHPAEAVMLGLTSFFIWWGVAAFIAWILRPSWKRGKSVLFAVGGLLLMIVGSLILSLAPAYLSPANTPTPPHNPPLSMVPVQKTATPTPTVIIADWYGLPMPTATPRFKPAKLKLASIPTAEPPDPTDAPPDGPLTEGQQQWRQSVATVSARLTAAAACVSWQDASQHIGQNVYICGTVVHTTNSGDSFSIEFSNDPKAYHAISFSYHWKGLEGGCYRILGTVENYKGRPATVIRDTSQLQLCP